MLFLDLAPPTLQNSNLASSGEPPLLHKTTLTIENCYITTTATTTSTTTNRPSNN